MQLTEKQIRDKINVAIGDIWTITFIESGGFNADYWVKYYDNYEEAMKDYNDTNKENDFNSNNVPDYYIIASEPVKVNWITLLHS